MICVLTMLIASALPQERLPDCVDLVELNHYHDGEGKRIFSQWIFYDWNAEKSRHDIVDWSMASSQWVNSTPSEPKKAITATKRGWLVVAGIRGQRREILAAQFRESWTQFDPELAERETLPKEKRRGFPRLPPREPIIEAGEVSVIRR